MPFSSLFSNIGPKFGSIFSNIGQRLGDVYNKALSFPVIGDVLRTSGINDVVQAGKQIFGAGKNLIENIRNRRFFQRPELPQKITTYPELD